MLILTVIVHKILFIKIFLNKIWLQNLKISPNVINLKEEQQDSNEKNT